MMIPSANSSRNTLCKKNEMNTKMYENTVKESVRVMNDGGKAVYVYGVWNSGGDPKTKEWALEKLNNGSWGFGMGCYTLNDITLNGEQVLQFKELHENDLW